MTLLAHALDGIAHPPSTLTQKLAMVSVLVVGLGILWFVAIRVHTAVYRRRGPLSPLPGLLLFLVAVPGVLTVVAIINWIDPNH